MVARGRCKRGATADLDGTCVRASDALCGALAAHAVFDGGVSCVCPPGRTLLAGRCVPGSAAVCAAAAAPPLPSQRRALAAAGAGAEAGVGVQAGVWDGRECGCGAGLSAGLGGCVRGSTALCRQLFGAGRVWGGAAGECRCGPGLAELGPGGGCVPATGAVCQWLLGPRGRADGGSGSGCGCEVGYTADVNGTCEQGSDGLCRARGGALGRFDGVGHCVCEGGAKADALGLCVAGGGGGAWDGAPWASGREGGARGENEAGVKEREGGAAWVEELRGLAGRAAGLEDIRRRWDAADSDGDGALSGEEARGWSGGAGPRAADRNEVGGAWHGWCGMGGGVLCCCI